MRVGIKIKVKVELATQWNVSMGVNQTERACGCFHGQPGTCAIRQINFATQWIARKTGDD